MGHFWTLVGRLSPHRWVLCTGLLAVLPCLAQPPGVLYSTTVPFDSSIGMSNGLMGTSPVVVAVTTDASGNSYVAGSVSSNGFAGTPGVVQPAYIAGTCPDFYGLPSIACDDAFIAKFDPHGTLEFLTYLGGTGHDIPYSIAVDAAGNIYVGGQTTSTDFPIAGTPWHPVLSSGGIFVAKLSGDGKRLIWSTVLNGSLLQLSTADDGSVYYLAQTFGEGSGTAALTKLTQDGQFVGTANVPSGTQVFAVGTNGSVYIGGSKGGSGIAATPAPGRLPTTEATPAS